jgi:NADPH:quinone reductase-like Zn-dependent oxidoreductase
MNTAQFVGYLYSNKLLSQSFDEIKLWIPAVDTNAKNARLTNFELKSASGLSQPGVTHRPTPTPGPNDLLIEVNSIALNPVDWYQRYHDFAITSYPAIIGSDISGTVVSAGSSVPSDAPKPGNHVSAYAPCSIHKSHLTTAPSRPACLSPPQTWRTSIPMGMSFNEACLLP